MNDEKTDDGYAEPVPDAELPPEERLNKPKATDDVKVPAPGSAPDPDQLVDE